jgi:hypothetical protein
MSRSKSVAKKVVKKSGSYSVVKKAAAKHAAKPVGKRVVPPGYCLNNGGRLLVPNQLSTSAIVRPSKLRQGLISAQEEIRKSFKEIAAFSSQDFEVAEIEVSISFNADGKFLGFGVGGAFSIKIKIKPTEQ